jgi:hypothetical protein
MSTLIERMILRARAPLSSLEPIAPVRFALRQQIDETPFTEVAAEPAEAPDHSLPPPPRAIGQNALPGERPPSPGLVPPETTLPGPITPADVQRPRARRDRRDQVDRSESVLVPAAPGAASEGPAVHATAAEVRTEPIGPVQPIPVTARLRPADLPGHAEGGVQAPAADTAADEPAHGPDITVTIGHIEVRAASPAPARPARVPFRPQVSLNDFLGNGQESRR